MKYNVILWDINKREFISYDIFPYLRQAYRESEKREERPKTFDEFKEFIRKESMYMWWSRCQYEILISDWPSQTKIKKIDVHYQVMMNIDIITKLFMEEINGVTSNRERKES